MSGADDLVAAFTVERAPLRGRIARLGPVSVDPILRRHDYPAPVALLLGEALAFAALLGSLLKFEGRVAVQAEGDGPLALLIAEHRSDGALRGYARMRKDTGAPATRRARPATLIGEGVLAITLDLGDENPPQQAFVPLEGETLSACAEAYFRDSEQIETRIKLAVGEVLGANAAWRAGGALVQKVAADDARGDTEEGWRRAAILFDTLTDAELLDPALPADRVLYRLFHEDGVRMADPAPLIDRCACDAARLIAVLKSLPHVDDLVVPDGLIHARCEFCARNYRLTPP